MYAHIGRLAILHISITYVYWYILEKKKGSFYFRNPGLKRTFG